MHATIPRHNSMHITLLQELVVAIYPPHKIWSISSKENTHYTPYLSILRSPSKMAIMTDKNRGYCVS
jgi:hypothetical protein